MPTTRTGATTSRGRGTPLTGRTNTTVSSGRRAPRVSHSVGQQTRVRPANRTAPNTHAIERMDINAEEEEEDNEVNTRSDLIQTTKIRTNGRLCDTFSGNDPLVKIDDWLGLFDIVTTGYTDEEKFIALCRHVTADAMTWAVRDIGPKRSTLSWPQIKTQMEKRFGRAVHNHLMEAVDRVLKPNETIESYFNEKKRLMDLAGENDVNQVALLTRGLTHNSMKSQIAAQRPNTPALWLEIALAVEEVNRDSLSSTKVKKTETSTHLNETKNEGQDNKGSHNTHGSKQFQRPDFTKPPTTPCPFCKSLDFKEFHWKRDCPRLKQIKSSNNTNNSNTSIVSSTSGTTHSTTTAEPLDFVHFEVNVNGIPLRPFLDSGSTITAMSRTAAERLKLKWNPEAAIPLKHIDGITKTLGAIDAHIRIQGKTFQFPIQVLNKFAHDMLLGLDIAHAAGLVVDFGKQVKFKTFALQPFDSSHHLVQFSPFKQNKLTERTDVFTQNTKDVELNHNIQHIVGHNFSSIDVPLKLAEDVKFKTSEEQHVFQLKSDVSLIDDNKSVDYFESLKSFHNLNEVQNQHLVNSNTDSNLIKDFKQDNEHNGHLISSKNQTPDVFSQNAVEAQKDSSLELQTEIMASCLKKAKNLKGLATVPCHDIERIVVPPSVVDQVFNHLHEEKQPFIKPLTHQMNQVPTPDQPNRIWAIDTIDMERATDGNAKFVFTVIDLHSRQTWAKAVKRLTSEAIISFLSNLFDCVGTPEQIFSIEDPNFTSKRFQNFLFQRGVKRLVTFPHLSQGNIFCETTNGHILARIRIARKGNPKLKCSSLLQNVVSDLNDRINETMFSPRFLHFGLTSSIPSVSIDEARRLATERSRADQERRTADSNNPFATNIFCTPVEPKMCVEINPPGVSP